MNVSAYSKERLFTHKIHINMIYDFKKLVEHVEMMSVKL